LRQIEKSLAASPYPLYGGVLRGLSLARSIYLALF
jgi:hypothetical protein